jgi:hypothetical protein
LAGNPGVASVTATGQYDDGSTFPLNVLPGTTFSSDNTGVFVVDTFGGITPAQAGTAHLIVSSGSMSVTNPITVLAPSVVRLTMSPTNLYIGGGTVPYHDAAAAAVFADFAPAAATNTAYSNVTVTAFNYVSFNSSPTSVATVTPAGIVTAVSAGNFTLTGTYAGMTSSNTVFGSVIVVPPSLTIDAFSVHITDTTNAPPAGSADAMNFRYVAGAPGVRLAYWNNFVYIGSTPGGHPTNTAGSLANSKGNLLPNTTVTMDAFSQGANNGGIGIVNNAIAYDTTQTGRTTNESCLFNTYFDQGGNSVATTSARDSHLVVSNIPYASYDAYFYFYNDTGATNRPGRLIIDGNAYWRNNYYGRGSSGGNYNLPDNNGNGYLQAITPPGFTAFPTVLQVPVGNYIKVAGLTDPNLSVTWGGASVDIVGDANATIRMRLAGFQIVSSLAGLTATNIYLVPTNVPSLFAGDPTKRSFQVLADFVGGIKGGDVTSLITNWVSSNTNVFTVDTNGGVGVFSTTNPGVATLTITYQTNVLVKSVTNLGPLSVKLSATPDTEYNDGLTGLVNGQASLSATFPGFTNMSLNGFETVSFIDEGSPVCSVDATGVITPSGTAGTAAIGGTYLGVTYVNPSAFTVRSISDPPILKHLYTFQDASGSSTVVDSIGGANGTILPPLGGNSPITLDGERANFPGDGTYSNCPYISLPSGLLGHMGDVTIQMWVGTTTNIAWERFVSFGDTTKGFDPHAFPGHSDRGLQFIPMYGGAPNFPDFQMRFTTSVIQELRDTSSWPAGREHQVVMVWSPNAGVAAYYLDGVQLVNTTALTGYTWNSINDTVDWLGVSLDNNDPPLAGWFNELRIYEGTMTAAQVVSDFSAGPSRGVVWQTPTNISASVTGGTLKISWAGNHLGWILQTNAVGLAQPGAWFPVPGSGSVTSQTFSISSTDTNVFFRLVQP